MSRRGSLHPVIGSQWHGQIRYKRTTDTRNLVRVDSPFRWHEKLAGAVVEIIRALRGNH
jgi:hypothetical protein